MALIKCPECGKEFSSFATACPNCGFPTSKLNEQEETEDKVPFVKVNCPRMVRQNFVFLVQIWTEHPIKLEELQPCPGSPIRHFTTVPYNKGYTSSTQDGLIRTSIPFVCNKVGTFKTPVIVYSLEGQSWALDSIDIEFIPRGEKQQTKSEAKKEAQPKTTVDFSAVPFVVVKNTVEEISYTTPLDTCLIGLDKGNGFKIVGHPESTTWKDCKLYKVKFQTPNICGRPEMPTIFAEQSDKKYIHMTTQNLPKIYVVENEAEKKYVEAHIREFMDGTGRIPKTEKKQAPPKAPLGDRIKQYFVSKKSKLTKKYLLGIAAIIIFAIIGRIVVLNFRDNIYFYSARRGGTVELLNLFIADFPDSEKVPEAKQLISEIDEEYFQRKLNYPIELIELDEVNYYLDNFHDGAHYNDALKMQKALMDTKAYEYARSNDTYQSWRTYKKNYPDGAYIAEADSALEAISIAKERKKDESAYRLANSVKTKEAWKRYLEEYPNGQHVKEAKAALKEIEEEEKYRNYSLPNGSQPYAANYGRNRAASYSLSSVTIKNGSSDVVVTFRKVSTGKVEGHVYVRKGNSASVNIPAGTYDVSFYYGKGWHPKKYIRGKRDVLIGGFLENVSFEKDSPARTFKEGYEYEYTLTAVANGNLSLSGSNEYDMF